MKKNFAIYLWPYKNCLSSHCSQTRWLARFLSARGGLTYGELYTRGRDLLISQQLCAPGKFDIRYGLFSAARSTVCARETRRFYRIIHFAIMRCVMHARIDAIYREPREKDSLWSASKLRRNGKREDGICEMRYKKTGSSSGISHRPYNLIRTISERRHYFCVNGNHRRHSR